jgi:hypothetical protein
MFLLVGKIPETEEELKSVVLNLLMQHEQNLTHPTYIATALTTYVLQHLFKKSLQ